MVGIAHLFFGFFRLTFKLTAVFNGESLNVWIEKYFDWVAWGFLAVLLLGFAVLKFL